MIRYGNISMKETLLFHIFILTKITKYECNLYQNCLYDYFAKLCTLCYLLNII